MATVDEVLHFIWDYSYGGRCDGGWVDRDDVHRYFARTDQSAELLRSMVVSGMLHSAVNGSRLAINTDALTPTMLRKMEDGPAYVAPTVQAVGDVRLVPSEHGMAIASGPGMATFDPHSEAIAYLSPGQNLTSLDFALKRAAAAAAGGKNYERKVTGEDIGDVFVRSLPETGQVEVQAVPWADEPDPDEDEDWKVDDDEIPATMLDDDDNEIVLTPAQRAAWADELQRERDEQRAAAQPPPPPSRIAVLDLVQVDQLRALLTPAPERVPSGVPDVG